MIEWADNIEVGTDIQAVKNSQPHFIEVDWGKPRQYRDTAYYMILKIKGCMDPLGMSQELLFIDGKYQYRYPHK